jgi:hypothetical protein
MAQRYKNKELLTASEIARYLYCQRAWWYDRNLKVRSYANPSPGKKQARAGVYVLALLFAVSSLLVLLLNLG